MLRQRVSFIVGCSILMVTGFLVWAQPATGDGQKVTTLDGKVFIGVVTQDEKYVKVKLTNGDEAAIHQRNVKGIEPFPSFAEEFDARLASVDQKSDIRALANLATMAKSKNDLDRAEKAAKLAQKVAPNNEVAKSVLAWASEQRKTTAPPDTQPKATDGEPAKPGIKGLTRVLTPKEINRIRQAELTDEAYTTRTPELKVRIDPQARTEFVARNNIVPGDFNRLKPAAQAKQILAQGTAEEKAGVTILSDPPSMVDFRRNIHKTLMTGCAAAGCHGGSAAGSQFVLHTVPERPAKDQEDEAVYTNYLILINYNTQVNGVGRAMVDRTQPEQSLLAHYMLPKTPATTPHPEVEGYKPIAKSTSDPRYQQVLRWLQSMPALPPDYGINLMQTDAPADPAPAAP